MSQKQKQHREVEEVINVSGTTVQFEIARGHGEPPEEFELAPGETAKLDASYARRHQSAPGRDTRPSTVELLTNKQVLPITDPRAKGALLQREAATKQAQAQPQAKAARG